MLHNLSNQTNGDLLPRASKRKDKLGDNQYWAQNRCVKNNS